MLLWVVIYSFLPANNFFSSTGSFVDEVEVLFSNVTFWATVVFSVMVALGRWLVLGQWRPSDPSPLQRLASSTSSHLLHTRR